MIIARKSKPVSTHSSSKSAFLLILAAISLTLLPLNAQQPPRPQRKGDKTAGPSLPTTSAEVARGKRIASQVETGMMFINNLHWSDAELPFGGIKNSGYGRELAADGIREFCNLKTVWVA